MRGHGERARPEDGVVWSRRRAMVELEQAAESSAAEDRPGSGRVGVPGIGREQNHVPFALVRALGVVVLEELIDRALQRSFAEEDHVIEALFLDRPDEPFRERVEIRTARRKSQALDAGG